MKPTSEILERMNRNSGEHPEGVYTRLYRYLLREDIYMTAYNNLYANKGAATKGTDNDTAELQPKARKKNLPEKEKWENASVGHTVIQRQIGAGCSQTNFGIHI